MNIVKRKLQQGQPTLGGWIMISHPATGELLAQCGFDWVAIDMEHTSVSFETIESIIRSMERYHVISLVRIAGHDPLAISRCLDIGAQGLIVPMVKSGDEARQIVREAKFPPAGRRSACLSRAAGCGVENFRRYYTTFNDEIIIVAMIEHIDAVNNIEEIVTVEGIDALFFGPFDLSGSMGIIGQFDHPDFISAIDKVKQAARKAKMPIGIHVIAPSPDEIRKRAEEGFQFIGCSIDTQIILSTGKTLAASLA